MNDGSDRCDPFHLLLAEDDRWTRGYVRDVLAPLGGVVTEAAHVDDARRCAADQPLTHALLDVRLEGGSGLALIPTLRQLHPAMRIIVCTAYPAISDATTAMKLGADDYLPKPLTPEQILAALELEAAPTRFPASETKLRSLDQAQWDHVQMVLTSCDGKIATAARHLGVHRQSLQRLLKRQRAQG